MPAFLEGVKLAIQAGLDLNTTDHAGEPPFAHLLNHYGMAPLLESLVSLGLDLKRQNQLGQIALHYYCTDPAIKALLLKQAFDVNHQDGHGDTPLHLCFKYKAGHDSLLKAGARWDIPNKAGVTALHLVQQLKPDDWTRKLFAQAGCAEALAPR